MMNLYIRRTNNKIKSIKIHEEDDFEELMRKIAELEQNNEKNLYIAGCKSFKKYLDYDFVPKNAKRKKEENDIQVEFKKEIFFVSNEQELKNLYSDYYIDYEQFYITPLEFCYSKSLNFIEKIYFVGVLYAITKKEYKHSLASFIKISRIYKSNTLKNMEYKDGEFLTCLIKVCGGMLQKTSGKNNFEDIPSKSVKIFYKSKMIDIKTKNSYEEFVQEFNLLTKN